MRRYQAALAALFLSVGMVTGCMSAKEAASPGAELENKKLERQDGAAIGGMSDELAADSSAQAPARPGAAAPPPPPPPAEAGERARAAEEAAPAEKRKPDAKQGRKLIMRGNVSLHVTNVPAGVDRIARIAEGAGGYVSDSNVQAAEGQARSATLTLRVPSARFDAVMTELRKAYPGVTPLSHSTESEDVTVQYVDTVSAIKNQQLLETELRKLLRERTGRLADLLEIERELARVRGEIEQAQGRLRQLANLVEMATIEVSLSEKLQVVTHSPWDGMLESIEYAWNEAQRKLANWVRWVLSTGIELVVYWAFVGGAALLLYLLAFMALRFVLIRKMQVMPELWFVRVWVALGLAFLGVWYPPFGALLVLTAIAALLLGAASAVVAKLFGRRRQLD